MRIVSPSAELIAFTPNPIALIERAGRVCYKSEERITETSASAFVKKLIASGHLSVLEHATATFHLVCDRGVSHELVRHRIASFSQESTRYCNYGKGDVAFVVPCGYSRNVPPGVYNSTDGHMTDTFPADVWFRSMLGAEEDYKRLLKLGQPPQLARSVLPNSLKTEVVITANFREWRLILQQRTSSKAHPDMQCLMALVKKQLVERFAAAFEDLAT